MADYYPLIARAVASARDAPAKARAEIYARARAALMKHLRAANPPLSADMMEREEIALAAAIAQVEGEIVGDAADTAPIEDSPEAASRPDVSRRPLAPVGGADPETAQGGRRGWRLMAIGVAVAAVAGGVAMFAVANKEDPARYQPLPGVAVPVDGQQPGPKIGQRVTDPASPSTPARPPETTASAPAASQQASNPASPAVAVAQRAILYEERPESPAEPNMVTGRAVWRLDSVAADQGQPADTVVKIELEFPERSMNVDITIRRNTEPALQASHLIEVKFNFRAGGGPVKELASPPTMKLEENQRGSPLLGLQVPVMENFFLIGLSSLPADIERNISQLQSANWIDVPFRFATDRIGVIAIEKGTQGADVIRAALERWRN